MAVPEFSYVTVYFPSQISSVSSGKVTVTESGNVLSVERNDGENAGVITCMIENGYKISNAVWAGADSYNNLSVTFENNVITLHDDGQGSKSGSLTITVEQSNPKAVSLDNLQTFKEKCDETYAPMSRALPAPAGTTDAGKVPTVNSAGNGYELQTPSMPALASERGTSADVAMSQLGIENIFYENNVQLGSNSNATGDNSIAIGKGATALGGGATAIGQGAKASSVGAAALGKGAIARNFFATAIGEGAKASGKYATALGSGATAETDNTIVLGNSNITALECQVQTISALSDKRVKEDVSLANTTQCLADVNRLPVSRYKYKDFTGVHLDVHRTGFMADDVEKVFPKAVIIADRTFPLLDEDGNKVYEQAVDKNGNPVIDESGHPVMKEKTFVMEDVKTIAMEMAIPTLWGAVQELSKMVESLKTEVQTLKANK